MIFKKKCSCCKQLKPLKSFHKNSKRKYGLEAYCKLCRKLKAIQFKERINLYHRKWNKLNKQKKIQNNKKWLLKNPNYYNKYTINRRKKDINFHLVCNLRSRLNSVLKYNYKSLSTLFLIGCEIDYLLYYLQQRFKPRMSWDNYGKGGWVVDHIKPCASFDLSDPIQQKECFHYTNLQPLWEVENLIKGSKNKLKEN